MISTLLYLFSILSMYTVLRGQRGHWIPVPFPKTRRVLIPAETLAVPAQTLTRHKQVRVAAGKGKGRSLATPGLPVTYTRGKQPAAEHNAVTREEG